MPPVGTGELVREATEKHQAEPDIESTIGSNWSSWARAWPSRAFCALDRIVIGAPNQQAAITLVELYALLERLDDHHGPGLALRLQRTTKMRSSPL